MASAPVTLSPDSLADFFARMYRNQTKQSSWVTLYVNIVDDNVGLEESNMFAYNSSAIMCNDETRTFIKLIFDNLSEFITGGTVSHEDAEIFNGQRTQVIQIGSKAIWLYFDSDSTAKNYARCMRIKLFERMEELVQVGSGGNGLPALPTITSIPTSPRSSRRSPVRVTSPRSSRRSPVRVTSPRSSRRSPVRVTSPRSSRRSPGRATSPLRAVSPRRTSIPPQMPSEVSEIDRQIAEIRSRMKNTERSIATLKSEMIQYDNWETLDEIHSLKRKYDMKVKHVRELPRNQTILNHKNQLERRLVALNADFNISTADYGVMAKKAEEEWDRLAADIRSLQRNFIKDQSQLRHLETNRNLLIRQ